MKTSITPLLPDRLRFTIETSCNLCRVSIKQHLKNSYYLIVPVSKSGYRKVSARYKGSQVEKFTVNNNSSKLPLQWTAFVAFSGSLNPAPEDAKRIGNRIIWPHVIRNAEKPEGIIKNTYVAKILKYNWWKTHHSLGHPITSGLLPPFGVLRFFPLHNPSFHVVVVSFPTWINSRLPTRREWILLFLKLPSHFFT